MSQVTLCKVFCLENGGLDSDTPILAGYADTQCEKMEKGIVWGQVSENDTTGQYWLRGALLFPCDLPKKD